MMSVGTLLVVGSTSATASAQECVGAEGALRTVEHAPSVNVKPADPARASADKLRTSDSKSGEVAYSDSPFSVVAPGAVLGHDRTISDFVILLGTLPVGHWPKVTQR